MMLGVGGEGGRVWSEEEIAHIPIDWTPPVPFYATYGPAQ